MSATARKNLLLFGSTGASSKFGQFGSLAAASPTTTKDIDTIQSLAAWLTGWSGAVIASNRPALQDMNAAFYVAFYQLFYIFEKGVPEWIATTTYFIGSIVNDGTGVLYKSIQDTNLNHALSDAAWWSTVATNQVGVQGSFKNLAVSRGSVTQVTATADQLMVEDTSHNKVTINSVNVTAAITASGANGLDTGSEASNTWYYLWVIRKSSDGTVASLLSVSSTAPTMPTGYDQKALVSAVRNDGSSNFINFNQDGTEYWYTTGQTAASGNTSGAWTAIDTSAFVPSALSTIPVGIGESSAGPVLMMSDNNSGSTTSSATNQPNRFWLGQALNGNGQQFRLRTTTANTIYWLQASGTAYIFISGFQINKLVG